MSVLPAIVPPRVRWHTGGLALLLLAGLGLSSATARENDTGKPAGKSLSDSGTFLARTELGKPWRPVEKNASVAAGDLLIGLPGATLESQNGAVRLTAMSDLDEVSPYPIVENAVSLKSEPGFDLSFVLDRGRVDLVNTRDKGEVKVRVHFRDRYWDLSLLHPGTRVDLEIYSRWLPGTRFNPKASKPGEGLVTHVVLVVLKGQVDRKCPTCQIALTAPPGPALYEWDNIYGEDGEGQKLDKLPEWATETASSEKALAKKARLDEFRKQILASSVETTLQQILRAESAEVRKTGIYACGALDELSLVADILNRSNSREDWHNAVVALRHWLGRSPEQPKILFQRLLTLRHYSEAEAKTMIQMLFGFSEEEIARPELYQVLIGTLDHKRLGIRGLANWHLQRLAPTVKVEFDPNGSPEDLERAKKAWGKAIPKGQLPPTLKTSTGEGS